VSVQVMQVIDTVLA